MLRKLLACLALLTGLAATGAPAQAEVASAMASRVEASALLDATPQATVGAICVAECPVRVGGAQTEVAPRHHAATARTVYVGGDRARE